MHEPVGHYDKRNKADKERQILYGILKRFIVQTVEWWLPEDGSCGKRGDFLKRKKKVDVKW